VEAGAPHAAPRKQPVASSGYIASNASTVCVHWRIARRLDHTRREGEVKVEFEELALVQQVLDRQRAHAAAVGRYLDDRARFRGDSGPLLGGFAPLCDAAAALGARAASALERLAGQRAHAATVTLDAYADAEADVHAALGRVGDAVGVETGPFRDPRHETVVLEPSSTTADADYGSWALTGFGDVGDTLTTAGRQVADLPDATLASGVLEVSDPESYLVAPDLGQDYMSGLRMHARTRLREFEWVLEQVAGVGVLEDRILKPFAGDWSQVKGVSMAWEHAGRALVETAANLTALPRQLQGWEGEAAARFGANMTSTAEAVLRASYAFEFTAMLAGALAETARAVARAVADLVDAVAAVLAGLAADAAVPVVDWSAGAFEAYDAVGDILLVLREIDRLTEEIIVEVEAFAGAEPRLSEAVELLESIGERTGEERT
jgi:hypothetical protein